METVETCLQKSTVIVSKKFLVVFYVRMEDRRKISFDLFLTFLLFIISFKMTKTQRLKI